MASDAFLIREDELLVLCRELWLFSNACNGEQTSYSGLYLIDRIIS